MRRRDIIITAAAAAKMVEEQNPANRFSDTKPNGQPSETENVTVDGGDFDLWMFVATSSFTGGATGVEFNGTPFTQIYQRDSVGIESKLWGLQIPDVGTHLLEVFGNISDNVAFGGTTFKNVGSISAATTIALNGPSVSLSRNPVAATDMMLSALCTNLLPGSFSDDPGQTNVFKQDDFFATTCAMSFKQGNGGNTTMGYNGLSGDFIMGEIALQVAP